MPATQVTGIVVMCIMCNDSWDQCVLSPVSLDGLVPQEHVCWAIETFVGALDLL
jgi:hypothetical protein